MCNLKSQNISSNNLQKNIWLMCAISFLQNCASVIVSSLTALVLLTLLGANEVSIGYIRGASEGLSYIMKMIFGVLSDYTHKRKIFIVTGYILAVFTKFIFAMSYSIWVYAAAQFIDRISNGMRDSPRDAMMIESANAKTVCTNLGMRQAMAYMGSMIGAIGLYFILSDMDHQYIRSIYLYVSIPVLISVIVSFFLVDTGPTVTAQKHKWSWEIVKEFQKKFWLIILLSSVFFMTKFSESFLTAYAIKLGFAQKYQPLVFVMLYSFSWPAAKILGKKSDMGDKVLYLLFCIGTLCCSYICFANAESSIPLFVIGVLLFAIQHGASNVIILGMLSDTIPHQDLKGTAVGIFGFVCAIGITFSSVAFGYCVSIMGYAAGFYIFAIAVAVAFAAILINKKHITTYNA